MKNIMKSLFIEFLCLIARFNSCYLPFQAYWRGQRIIQWWFTVLRSEEIILHYQLYMMTMHADHLDDTILLKLEPVQDLSFKFWLGYKVLTELAGLFFFKSKRRRFSKKKQKKQKLTGLQSGLAGSTRRITPGFSFPHFFFNSAQFQPRVGRIPDRPARPVRISKL